ncbi:MAG: polysaccharide lyase family protein, partial [Phycisphaerae bacterium]
MKQRIGKNIPAAAVLLLGGLVGRAVTGPASEASRAELLWQIGKADNDTRELALAPKGYTEFSRDALFIVGRSDARKDWPYVHPGPTDAWAGGRQHTFSIAFGLKAAPEGGECRLILDLVDTHGKAPPRLRVSINGHAVELRTPRGAGDASVMGEPEKGKEHRVVVPFPAGQLRAGTNEIAIITLSGSWVLYDWLALEAPAGVELAPATGTMVQSVRSTPALVEKGGKLQQTVQVSLLHLGGEADAEVQVGSLPPTKLKLRAGANTIDAAVPAVEKDTAVTVTVRAAGRTLAERELTLKPVRKWVIYLLPHSHVDIGYTQIQTKVERDHWRFYEQAIEASRKTADYPQGAQFKWNVEVLWATDSYLRQASPEKRKAFIEAVRAGWIGLDALYGNELTALCSQEELIRLTDFARRL